MDRMEVNRDKDDVSTVREDHGENYVIKYRQINITALRFSVLGEGLTERQDNRDNYSLSCKVKD